MSTHTVKFSNGIQMPLVGLGTWQSTEEVVKKSVKAAVKIGYRLIDTATLYGNEGEIGEALQELYDEGVVTREDLFITTKMFVPDMHPDKQESAVRRSLELLKTDYIDLYLLHCPPCVPGGDLSIEDVWRGMEKLYEKGLMKAVGVSNFTLKQMERVIKIGKVPIHCTQNEIQRYLPQKELLEFCKKHDIRVTGYGSLGSNGRTNAEGWEWTEAPNALEDPYVIELAEKYRKTPAQILLRWLTQQNIAVIPKSTSDKRLKENFEIFDFSMEESELKQLSSPKDEYRLFIFHMLKGLPEDPLADFRDNK